MAYKVHNFLTGDKLKAASLNEMDAQIKANAEGVSLFTMDTIVAAIKQMRLTTDGEYLYLYYGDTLLDEAAVSDASDIIQCEGLTVTSPTYTDLTVTVGGDSADSETIKTAITPSDCSQTVRFRSSDITVANVTSAGVVTGRAKGRATVTVTCGKYKKVFPVAVREIIRPTWVTGNWVTAPYTFNGQTGMNVDVASSAKRALCYPYTDQKSVYLKKGEKISVLCPPGYVVQFLYKICPGDGELTFTTVAHNGNPFIVVDTDNGGSASSSEMNIDHFEMVADKNCYVGLCIMRDGTGSITGDFTAEECKQLEKKISIIVYPAQA